MANLDPQVQIKLIEISKEWTEKVVQNVKESAKGKLYLENFDTIYKQLVKTMSEK